MNYVKTILSAFIISYAALSGAMEVPIYDFPITYSQQVSDYLPENTKNHTQSLLSAAYQKEQLQRFYNHYYGDGEQGLSPWSAALVTSVMPFVKQIETNILEEFNNQTKADAKKHYGENFKEKSDVWWQGIKENMDFAAMDMGGFNPDNRAIAVVNTSARALPDGAPDFLHPSLPGEGFPFDNLQQSAIWIGTPLYVISVTKDKAWSLVLTPDAYITWVKSDDIGYVPESSVGTWQKTAQYRLVAITETQATITNRDGRFLSTAYIGAVFPGFMDRDGVTKIIVPVKSSGRAYSEMARVSTRSVAVMPMSASPQNFAHLMKQLKNRPYGWGGAYFYNDCSQEMKSLFAPFGIWLPRNSAQQAKLSAEADLSQSSPADRMNTLKAKGRPLMTLVYVGGHVMLYVGQKNIENQKNVPITYQNLWGMAPENRDKRYVVGQSLFFPLLTEYSGFPDVVPLTNKQIFKLINIDKLDSSLDSPSAHVKAFF